MAARAPEIFLPEVEVGGRILRIANCRDLDTETFRNAYEQTLSYDREFIY